jgi:hypothetical protein
MNWKTILVHLDNSRRCETRTRLALDIARRFDAHVVGLYLVCQDLAHRLFDPEEPVLQRARKEMHRISLDNARATFEHAAQLAGVNAEWRAPEGSVHDAATLHGRHATSSYSDRKMPTIPRHSSPGALSRTLCSLPAVRCCSYRVPAR